MSDASDSRMSPSWRPPGVSSRLSSFRDFVSQKDLRSIFEGRNTLQPGDTGSAESSSVRQRWSQWAGDKIRRKTSANGEVFERVSIFPGWAARRYHNQESANKEGSEFTLEVFVSGFAASYPPPELASRSQRAFLRLAKAFAALPKLPSMADPPTSESMPALQLSPSTEELLKHAHLPPTPSEITEETEMEALESQFRHANPDVETASVSSGESEPPSPLLGSSPVSSSPHLMNANPSSSSDPSDLYRLHANLTERVQAFWSRWLPNRTIRLSVRTCNADPSAEPVFSQNVVTTPQGAFQALLTIPWERLCTHRDGVFIAFGDPQEEQDLHVEAELLPPTNPISSTVISAFTCTVKSAVVVPVTQSNIRLISDIDDTIKLSNILGGARTVFRNVFVRRLEELVINGMGEWYTGMWSRGVRFHYVSNGPFQLLPVVNEFIKVSNLPQGSIKLKAYNGRSLFDGLLSTPAMRKRDGILDILNAFNSSRFFLVGDTGEQDLELYALLAEERHHQILAVFVRDASGPGSQPLDDPTGENIKHRPAPLKRASSFGFSRNKASPLEKPALSVTRDTPTLTGTETPTQSDYQSTPRADPRGSRLMPSSFRGRKPMRSSSLNVSSTPSDYISANTSASEDNRTPVAPLRSPTDPTSSTSGSFSTFSDASIPYSAESPTNTPSSNDVRLPQAVPGVLSPAEVQALSPQERRRYELQERVWKARLTMPSHIPLRIFTEPEECIEANQILDNLAGVQAAPR